jgi:hypothetical protein
MINEYTRLKQISYDEYAEIILDQPVSLIALPTSPEMLFLWAKLVERQFRR